MKRMYRRPGRTVFRRTLTSISIDVDGRIYGLFSNGRSAVLAQFALADFANPAGPVKADNGTFGFRQLGSVDVEPGYGCRRIRPGALEMSNVDLSKGCGNDRHAAGFQANSRIIDVRRNVAGARKPEAMSVPDVPLRSTERCIRAGSRSDRRVDSRPPHPHGHLDGRGCAERLRGPAGDPDRSGSNAGRYYRPLRRVGFRQVRRLLRIAAAGRTPDPEETIRRSASGRDR